MKKDFVSDMAAWCERRLVVPTGPLTSKPFRLDGWQIEWLRGAFSEGIREAGLSVARKNGKTGLIAGAMLYCLHNLGPNWRAAVCSLTGRLAAELKIQMQQMVVASELEGITFRQTPQPGLVLGPNSNQVDFLAADRATGHAIGCDLIVIDEAGLLQENARGLWDAMLSSVSGRDGKLFCISIRGDGEMFAEMGDREGDSAVYWKEYAAKLEDRLDDPAAWRAANPGLESGIKSVVYMQDMSRRALANFKNVPNFQSFDLNLPQEPTREMILTVSEWKACEVRRLPVKTGPLFVGFDLGGSASMSACTLYWPASGRMEVYGAFAKTPNLEDRGLVDGVGGLYRHMQTRRELKITPGRVTDIPVFLNWIKTKLENEKVARVAVDRYRKEEFIDAMERSSLKWPVEWRGQGHSHTADGSYDVRAFQTEVMSESIRIKRSLLMEAAIAGSSIMRDPSGNPKLDKARTRARIDALSSAVLACGLAVRYKSRVKPGRTRRHAIV